MSDVQLPRQPVELLNFRAEGILGGQTYSLDLRERARIIVGPNGTGKSTFLSLFYLFLSRQWARLGEYDFSELFLSISLGGKIQKISIKRQDLMSSDASLSLGSPERNWSF